MRAAGFEIRVYSATEAFLAESASAVEGCALLDITLPKITGLKLKAQLTALARRLPVIAISARDDEETRTLARDLGARIFLRKPVDDQALLDAIDWLTDVRHPSPSE